MSKLSKKIRFLGRQKYISKNKEGKNTADGLPSSWNKDYAQAVIRYLNCLESLFDRAQEKTDFQFILTLLRVRGIQSSGEDPYRNSLETIDKLLSIEKTFKGRTKTNIFLWVYGHIVESSEPYEIIANLLHVCGGKTFRTFNFPYRKTRHGYRPQSPREKINHLEKLAKKVKMSSVLDPIKEIFDKNLRNAVFHSDYAVSEGQVFINEPRKIYSRNETLTLLNKTLAYHETIKILINTYTKSYDIPKIIETTPEFSKGQEEKAQIIVRKEHGVVALQSAKQKESSKKGRIPWFIGNIFNYEQKLINKGQFLLPKNRIDFWNNILFKMPDILYKRLIGPIEKYIINK